MFSAAKSEGVYVYCLGAITPLAIRSQHHKKHRFTAVFTVTLSDIHTNKGYGGHYQQLKQLLPVRINTEHLHFASLYLGTHQVGRHSFATALEKEGWSSKAIADAGGWKSVGLVDETYIHTDNASGRASDMIGRKLAHTF